MRDDDLIEPLIPVLRRFAWALCRDPHDADDLVQDCIERALDRWQSRRRDSSLRAWLFTILYNGFIDGRRRSVRRGTMSSIDDLGMEPTVAETQEQGLHVRDVMERLDRLPDDYKAVLLLIGVEDLTYDEAARVLDIPIGTVMSRLSRGREKLRGLLSADAPTHLRRVK